MKNEVIKILKETAADYDERMLQTYWIWADKYGTSPSHVQQLLANAAVNKWFMIEFGKLEKQFVDIVTMHALKPDQIKHQYYASTMQIYKMFPKPLIDNCKNLNKDFINNYISNIPLIYAN